MKSESAKQRYNGKAVIIKTLPESEYSKWVFEIDSENLLKGDNVFVYKSYYLFRNFDCFSIFKIHSCKSNIPSKRRHIYDCLKVDSVNNGKAKLTLVPKNYN